MNEPSSSPPASPIVQALTSSLFGSATGGGLARFVCGQADQLRRRTAAASGTRRSNHAFLSSNALVSSLRTIPAKLYFFAADLSDRRLRGEARRRTPNARAGEHPAHALTPRPRRAAPISSSTAGSSMVAGMVQ